MSIARAAKYAWPLPGTICRRLVDLMLDGKGHDYAEMVDALYGEDADGGPLNVHAVLRLMIARLRHSGWAIVLERRRVYRLDLSRPLPRDEGRPAAGRKGGGRLRYRPRAEDGGQYWWFNAAARVAWPGHPLDGVLVLVKRAPCAYRSYHPSHPQGLDLGRVVVVRPVGALSGGADFLLPPERLQPVKPAMGKQPADSETLRKPVSRETTLGAAA